jgi:hypothetical protein
MGEETDGVWPKRTEVCLADLSEIAKLNLNRDILNAIKPEIGEYNYKQMEADLSAAKVLMLIYPNGHIMAAGIRP